MLRDLQRAGLKLTPQRMAIVRLFADDGSHPTAQDLFERLRPTFPSMSFATVYNTLDALARAGLAGIVRLPGKRGDAARFDPNTRPHHHAVCDGCGSGTRHHRGHSRAYAGRRREGAQGGAGVLRSRRRAHLPRPVRALCRKTRSELTITQRREHMAKSLQGTKTHQNLKDAFAGESQANRRYLYFAKGRGRRGLSRDRR